LITGAICRNQKSEDGDPAGFHTIERVDAAMSKDRQWIGFIRNHCVWALWKEGRKLELCLNSVVFVLCCFLAILATCALLMKQGGNLLLSKRKEKKYYSTFPVHM
jgi:hypothetical protein